MFSTLFKLALLAAPALADFSISRPDFFQCKDAVISWEKTKGPYNLIIVNATDPCGDSVADLGDHDGTQITWKVALPAGYQVQLSLEDINGEEAWSGNITVGAGEDDSCIPASLKVAVPETTKNSTDGGNVANVANENKTPTVVITPTLTVNGNATPSPSSSSTLKPVGAANAGANPLGNGAPSLRQASTPVLVLGALAAVVAAAL